MQVHIHPVEIEVFEALAEHFADVCESAMLKKERVSVVLSGGNSPKRWHQLLVSPQYRNKIDWKRLDFFFGDERYVPFSDPAYNGGMAKTTLFDPLDISSSQVHYIDTSLPPEDAAREYYDRILAYFKNVVPRFDFVLLGIGDNVHTASLFPGTPVLHTTEATVASVYIEEVAMTRITMTAPLLNNGADVSFLAFGKEKAAAVAAAIEGKKDIARYPAQLIAPVNGTLHWFLDEPAASLLHE